MRGNDGFWGTMQHWRNLKKTKGFSLSELLIVLSILIILLVVTVPSQSIFFKKTQEQIIRSQLFHAIQIARNEAMVRGVRVTLCKSDDLKTCGGDWRNGYIMHANAKLLFVFQNTNNDGKIYWRAFPKNREDLLFLPTGATHSENGTFWYCQKTHLRWAIIISQSGRVRIVYPDKNGNVPVDVKC